MGVYVPRGKRAMDLASAALLLIALSAILVAAALLVRIFLGAPILFRQARTGLHGRIFTLLKFRTMADLRDRQGNLLPDEQRMGMLGRFLRTSSIDELPELVNVLRGEMSLVGPRPLLPQYLDRYTPEQRRRHLVLPGLTGWAQVRGRNALTWPARFALDVEYVERQSFAFDLWILLLTPWSIVTARGIRHQGHATMYEFKE
jgi:sugar transferase EpsL